MMKTLLLVAFVALAFCYQTTYDNGKPIDNQFFPQTASRTGPILLQDTLTIERLARQNRERIPERTVHARGATAFGVFTPECDDCEKYTQAKVFTSGKPSPIAVRFSSTIHGRDSPEYLRDPRGFALKFYSEEGNYDIVGLNFPVFFIRDGIRFPDMIRSLKPNPVTGKQEIWRILDFFSHVEEATHMFTHLFDDAGVPQSYRHVDGHGVHTFKWVAKDGSYKFVRYHWISKQGVKSFKTDEEAMKMHFSGHTNDLFESIKMGKFPKWDLKVQIMDPKEVAKQTFDPIDPTNLWPEDKFPLKHIGQFVLNKNVQNQFLENEQIAFTPANLVPGVEASHDKVLQARLFSYQDAHRYRLGINHMDIPVNRPKCPFAHNHIDGQMNTVESSNFGAVNYFPSNKGPLRNAKPFVHDPEVIPESKPVRMRFNENPDNFSQPRAKVNSFDEMRKKRFAMRIAEGLADEMVTPRVYKIWIERWEKVDMKLAGMIKVMRMDIMDKQAQMKADKKKMMMQNQ